MMHAIKTPAFLRPSSRPSSPAPHSPSRQESGPAFERVSRPLNRLSLSSFRRPSPSPISVSTPIPVTLIQDGSYLEMLSLKLSEAVSKALAQPTGPATVNEQVGGRRPIPAGRGRALSALIASELKATQDNCHLHRAIVRCLHRPLSVLLTNLSAHLPPLLSSPACHSPPAPTPQLPNPNPTQLHALGLSNFAGELLEGFDQLGLGLDGDIRGDGLKVIREGLVSIVTRVVNPLLAGIRNELMPLLEALERPNHPNANNGVKAVAGTKSSHTPHLSIVGLQCVMPLYARAVARYTPSPASQTLLAAFLISVVWRGLVALSHRPYIPPPPSPVVVSRNRSSSSTTPPQTPPSTRFSIKLPPSRPPSPPSSQLPSAAAMDARALFDLLNLLPRPAASKETTDLAREAVDEAFDGLRAMPALLEALQPNPNCKGSIQNVDVSESQLEALTADLPTLIALPILLQSRILVAGEGVPGSVASMLGLSEEEYRKGCLSGFGRAEECAAAVSQQVFSALCASGTSSDTVLGWLEAEMAAVNAER